MTILLHQSSTIHKIYNDKNYIHNDIFKNEYTRITNDSQILIIFISKNYRHV